MSSIKVEKEEVDFIVIFIFKKNPWGKKKKGTWWLKKRKGRRGGKRTLLDHIKHWVYGGGDPGKGKKADQISVQERRKKKRGPDVLSLLAGAGRTKRRKGGHRAA